MVLSFSLVVLFFLELVLGCVGHVNIWVLPGLQLWLMSNLSPTANSVSLGVSAQGSVKFPVRVPGWFRETLEVATGFRTLTVRS